MHEVRSTVTFSRRVEDDGDIPIPAWAQTVKAWAKGGGDDGAEASDTWDADTLGSSIAVSVSPGGTTSIGDLSAAAGGDGDAEGYGFLLFEGTAPSTSIDFESDLDDAEELHEDGLLMTYSVALEMRELPDGAWIQMPDGLSVGAPEDIAAIAAAFG